MRCKAFYVYYVKIDPLEVDLLDGKPIVWLDGRQMVFDENVDIFKFNSFDRLSLEQVFEKIKGTKGVVAIYAPDFVKRLEVYEETNKTNTKA